MSLITTVAERKRRKEICGKCPDKIGKFNCKHCKCFIWGVIRVAAKHCPKKKF